ncbi:MAG TPA: hypothetical protein VG755_43950 [Nannocystaceae bacterium]|nr:hypothetical protein [Nannocystaceae bacterium]
MTTMHRAGLLIVCAFACGESTPPVEAMDSSSSDESSSSSSTTDAPEPASSVTTEDMRLDLPTPVAMGCQKIDFLFVIDDSGSMVDEQARLIDGFPGFIADIQEAIAQYDYHMMVVTPDGMLLPDDPTACDATLGAGRIVSGDGSDCGLAGPDRFVSAADDPEELASMFGCLADVGTAGNGHEMPIWAMAQAVTEQSNPGGCNEGFLRDDAILVVTIITDEEDDAMLDSPGDPALWHDVMLSAKYGDPKAIVMLGLIGDTDLDDAVCQPSDGEGHGAEAAPRLRELVDSFPHGQRASVCLDEYASFFNAAIADIGEACTEFEPPG